MSELLQNLLDELDQWRSITEIKRRLEQRGFSINRLVLSGYLQALRDLDYVEEHVAPPSKLYRATERKSVYSLVGAAISEVSSEDGGDLALYTLSKLLGRPVFKSEIERCAVGFPDNFRRVMGQERQEAIKVAKSTGYFPRRNESAYLPTVDLQEEYRKVLEVLTRKLLTL